MLQTLKLFLPALLPSWRFFDVIAPSPRIQFTLLNTENENPTKWSEFRPRPEFLPFITMLKRLLWNPQWNESLFMVSCAERLIEHPNRHSEEEILKRIIREYKKNNLNQGNLTASYLQFRLILIQRQDNQLEQTIVFHSRIQPLHRQNVQ